MPNYLIQLTSPFVVQSEILSHHELIDLALDPGSSEEKSTASHVKTLEFPSLKSSPVPYSHLTSFSPLQRLLPPFSASFSLPCIPLYSAV